MPHNGRFITTTSKVFHVDRRTDFNMDSKPKSYLWVKNMRNYDVIIECIYIESIVLRQSTSYRNTRHGTGRVPRLSHTTPPQTNVLRQDNSILSRPIFLHTTHIRCYFICSVRKRTTLAFIVKASIFKKNWKSIATSKKQFDTRLTCWHSEIILTHNYGG